MRYRTVVVQQYEGDSPSRAMKQDWDQETPFTSRAHAPLFGGVPAITKRSTNNAVYRNYCWYRRTCNTGMYIRDKLFCA